MTERLETQIASKSHESDNGEKTSSNKSYVPCRRKIIELTEVIDFAMLCTNLNAKKFHDLSAIQD